MKKWNFLLKLQHEFLLIKKKKKCNNSLCCVYSYGKILVKNIFQQLLLKSGKTLERFYILEHFVMHRIRVFNYSYIRWYRNDHKERLNY